MNDTLDKLVQKEIRDTVTQALRMPLVTYGVWIPGEGWLKNENKSRWFSDTRIQMAQAAARMYGQNAFVSEMDDSMREMEVIFLRQEQKRISQRLTVRLARWIKKWVGSTK